VAAAAQPALQEHHSGRCRKDEAVTRESAKFRGEILSDTAYCATLNP
jgi:hypothetical protein